MNYFILTCLCFYSASADVSELFNNAIADHEPATLFVLESGQKADSHLDYQGPYHYDKPKFRLEYELPPVSPELITEVSTDEPIFKDEVPPSENGYLPPYAVVPEEPSEVPTFRGDAPPSGNEYLPPVEVIPVVPVVPVVPIVPTELPTLQDEVPPTYNEYLPPSRENLVERDIGLGS